MTSLAIYCKISLKKKKNKSSVQILHSRINNQAITQEKMEAFLDHAMKKVSQNL